MCSNSINKHVKSKINKRTFSEEVSDVFQLNAWKLHDHAVVPGRCIASNDNL